MKVWRLIAGIISVLLFVIIMFQSCAAGVANALSSNGSSSGSIGFLVGILMLAGGIVSLVFRKSSKKGGDIALIVLYGLAAYIGIACHGNYGDLAVWAVWCLVNLILAVIALYYR